MRSRIYHPDELLNPDKREVLTCAGEPSQVDRAISFSDITSVMSGHLGTISQMGQWYYLGKRNEALDLGFDQTNHVQWISENVHVQDRVALLKNIADTRANGEVTVTQFRTLQHSALVLPVWMEMRCGPIEGSNCLLTMTRDITEVKELEDKLLIGRQEAEKSNLAKSRFLANMSHELRTPLNAIIGFSEILKSGMLSESAEDKKQEYHGLIHDSAIHLLNVLNDILDMSKIEAGKYDLMREETDTRELVTSCVAMLQPIAIKSQVQLVHRELNAENMAFVDPRAIRQILINLISNAIKFSAKNDQVFVETRRIGKNLELSVTDSGIGMEQDKVDGLGQPFHQLDSGNNRNHEGAGLGLSIVKGLVSLHDGELQILSKKGIGTRVVVSLPLKASQSQPVPASENEMVIRISGSIDENRNIDKQAV